MFTFHFTADVPDDRRVFIDLPESVPIGKTRLVVCVEPDNATPEPRDSSLADWVAKYSEDLGDTIRSDDVEGFTGRRY